MAEKLNPKEMVTLEELLMRLFHRLDKLSG